MARRMVEPRSALALLEFADAAGAQLLRQHSLAVSAPSTTVHHSLDGSIKRIHWLPELQPVAGPPQNSILIP